ncbi:MAG TPA: hypothetical protein VN818_03225 [Gammaproteobacteria bacterium]|nr:hypothetical protein [Gammaproteobacteria bacterium]
MHSRRAVGWPLALTAALASVAAGQAESTPLDEDRAGWMLGLNAQADEHDAHSLYATSYVGVGSRTWLTFAAGKSSSPIESTDIEADTFLVGIDHHFDKVGFTLEAERWGDSGELETTDFSGSVYFDRDRWRVGFGYEHRDIEIPFTVTGPLGRTFSRTVDLAADGLSFDANVTLAERWRLYVGLEEFDYERDLAVLPRIASLNLLSASTLTLANSFLDHDRFIAVERDLGRATVLSLRLAKDQSAIDSAALETIEAAVLFPIGRRVDLEVNLGHGRSDFFQDGYYGGLSFLIYGR